MTEKLTRKGVKRSYERDLLYSLIFGRMVQASVIIIIPFQRLRGHFRYGQERDLWAEYYDAIMLESRSPAEFATHLV